MNKKIIDIFKSGNIVIPVYLLQNYKKFNLDISEFVFLMYLNSFGNNFIFNPKKIGEDLNISLGDVMKNISVLTDKSFIDVKVIKNDKGVSEEVVNLDTFYSKLSLLFMDDVNNVSSIDDSSCFDFIEKEFGRTLSPMEYEIIKAWLESGNSEEVIKEAVKEATFNGVSNLRYIDKILYEWNKKGIKTKSDVEKNRVDYKKSIESSESETEDIFDYNWFEEEDIYEE